MTQETTQDRDQSNANAATREKNDFQDSAFYEFIIYNLPVAILTVNSKFKITSFNPWAEEMTGYSEKEVIDSFCSELLQGEMCKLNCPLKTVIKRQNPILRIETTIKNKNGETIPVRMNTAALFDDNDNLIGGVESFQDISPLKAMEREKDNLISMFAHDMKSSTTIIGGFALRLLKKAGHLKEERRKKYLETIRKEAGNLEYIVEDFLEFAQLQTGKIKLNFAPTSLDRELMELFDAYQVKAKQSKIYLEFQTDEVLPIIEADSKRLRRVFTNLLDNAFKFSKEKGKIILATQETDGEIIVTIEDQGSGIDPGDLPNIFDAFHRGRGTEKEEGSGVGLAAVKAIVEGHGGRIRVKSDLGKGSTFTVVLPKAGRPENN